MSQAQPQLVLSPGDEKVIRKQMQRAADAVSTVMKRFTDAGPLAADDIPAGFRDLATAVKAVSDANILLFQALALPTHQFSAPAPDGVRE